jgi:hypothetical protein
VSVTRANPWIVIAVATALVLLVVTALVLLVEPGVMHAIGAALQGPGRMAPICNGTPLPC